MVPLLLVGHELLLAKAARVTAVVVVGAFMHVADVSARESLATHRAEEGPLEAVRVPSKAVCPRKRHAAFLTAERSDARVDYLDVIQHCLPARVLFLAVGARPVLRIVVILSLGTSFFERPKGLSFPRRLLFGWLHSHFGKQGLVLRPMVSLQMFRHACRAPRAGHHYPRAEFTLGRLIVDTREVPPHHTFTLSRRVGPPRCISVTSLFMLNLGFDLFVHGSCQRSGLAGVIRHQVLHHVSGVLLYTSH